MRENKVKTILKQGGVSLGVMCLEFATSGIGPLSADAGADFALYDMEHTGWSLETIKNVIAASRGVDMVSLVRVPTLSYHFIAHALDVGAMGIIVPQVSTAEQAKEAVRFAKYPPLGTRGAAFALAHDNYRGGDIAEMMRSANENVMVIAQIESCDGLANVDAIAAIEGIDGLWMGQFDLTTSMGMPGNFEHPDFLAARDKIVAACHKHKKTAALGLMNPDELAAGPARGFNLLIYTADLWIYQQALRRCFKQIRETLESDKKSP